MRGLLKSVCGVKEMHPMMAPFAQESSLNDLTARCESLFKNNDSMFKKEPPYSPNVDGGENGDNITTLAGEIPEAPELGPDTEQLNQERDNLFREILAGEDDERNTEDNEVEVSIDNTILEDTFDGIEILFIGHLLMWSV
jgi:hypothetical protein